MALRTVGTNANNSLSAFVVGFNDLIPADVATLNVGILADPPGYGAHHPALTTGLENIVGTVRPKINQPYQQTGILHVPRRGLLRLMAGDVVAFDTTTGWPIVISGDCFANGAFTHS